MRVRQLLNHDDGTMVLTSMGGANPLSRRLVLVQNKCSVQIVTVTSAVLYLTARFLGASTWT